MLSPHNLVQPAFDPDFNKILFIIAVALSLHTEPIWGGLFKLLCYQTLDFSLQWLPSLTYFHNPKPSPLCVCVCARMSVHELCACVHLVCMNVLMHMEDRCIHRMPSWNTLLYVFCGSPCGTQHLAGVITVLKKSFEFKLACLPACILLGCEKVLIKSIRKNIFAQMKEHIIY